MRENLDLGDTFRRSAVFTSSKTNGGPRLDFSL